MANKKLIQNNKKVYIRKIRRKMAKREVGNNRIKKYWYIYG